MNFFQPRRPRRLVGGFFLLLLLGLGGCAAAPGEMGARFGDPNAALSAALGSNGWLGPMQHVALHALIDAPDSSVALYSAQALAGTGWVVGVADAKRDWRGWYAHGRIGALAPPAPADELSCLQATAPAGGTRWLVVAGRFDPARVARVEVVTVDGNIVPVAVRDDLFTAMTEHGSDLRAVRALDAGGTLLAELPAAACTTP